LLGCEEVRIVCIEGKTDMGVEGEIAHEVTSRDVERLGARVADDDVGHREWITTGTGVEDRGDGV